MPKPNTRPRGRSIRVWTTPEERTAITERANAAGLSASAYLRTLGLGYEPRSVYDAQAVLTLAKVNGDQGRLGGLLKMWLTTRRGEGATADDVNKLLAEVRETQIRLRVAVEELKVN